MQEKWRRLVGGRFGFIALYIFRSLQSIIRFDIWHISISLRTADAFPVVASLPPKNSVCEPERQNDFRDVKPLVLM